MDILPRVKNNQFPYTTSHYLTGRIVDYLLGHVLNGIGFVTSGDVKAIRRVAYNLAASHRLGGVGVTLFKKAVPPSDALIIIHLRGAGVVDIEEGAKGRSRVMTAKIPVAMVKDSVAHSSDATGGRVVLKVGDKKTSITHYSKELVALNDFTARGTYTYKPTWSDSRVELASDSVRYDRMFINNLHTYGRFLAQFQSLSKVDRATLQIDGRPTCECDFSAMHPTLLYAEDGRVAPDDVYEIIGVRRTLRPYVKLAMLILINAKDYESACVAIQSKVPPQINVPSLIARIKHTHRAIAHHFHTNAGIRLMNTESNIAAQVFDTCIQNGIQVLGIHDGFICKRADARAVQAGMVDAFKKVTGYTGEVKTSVK